MNYYPITAIIYILFYNFFCPILSQYDVLVFRDYDPNEVVVKASYYPG